MRRIWIIVMAVVCLTAVGCHRNRTGGHGVVCRITVQCENQTVVYTAQDKMAHILNGLRQLGQKTLATINPDTLAGEAYEITLECTDGNNTVYHTKGTRFLQKNQEPWQQTDPKALSELLLLFQELTPDE